MNYRLVAHFLGMLLLVLAGLMLLPLICALVYHESVIPFAAAILISAVLGFLLYIIKPRHNRFYAREGFILVGLSWLFLSLIGCIPYMISGDIPAFADAFFETVSGFTTTGATIANDVESFTRSCLFWRIFAHWIGGMGVLVFVMAVMPMSGEHSMHVLRAEVPGPVVGKLVPRARKSSEILYGIYVALTLVETVLLMLGGMNFYDAVLHAFSTAGTGGFSTRGASVAAFDSAYIEMVIAVFMVIFSFNFNLFFLVLIGKFKDAVKSEELHVFLIIIAVSVLLIASNITSMYGSFVTALRHSFFNVATIISTTGFGTVDFNLWPETSKWILVLLMLIGGCAGSTAGGLKMSRVIVLFKAAALDIRRMVHPRSVNIVRLEKNRVDDNTVRAILTYFFLYLIIILFGSLIISRDGFGFTSSFTATIACISNVGPGLDKVGPMGNYADFSVLSKFVLSFVMLMGRLEIYPVLMLFFPHIWKLDKSGRSKH